MSINRFYLVILSTLFVYSFSSCEKKEYQTIEELDNENINAYISKNNLQVLQYKNTDLFYEVTRPGTGLALRYGEKYPIVFTMKSLDGVYNANDTLLTMNRYYDFLGYFPFGTSYAGYSNSPVERLNDLKDVVKDILGYTNGQIRIIVPSRLTSWGRKGDRDLGIPPNASMDYLISIHEDVDQYEDMVIKNSIVDAGFSVDEFTKTTDDIYYKILTPGTGDVITADSTITANYTLRDPAGKIKDSDDGLTISLAGGSIVAWTKMIPLIRKGGKIRFFSPSKHGYGLNGGNGMPPFMSLDFEVEIKDN